MKGTKALRHAGTKGCPDANDVRKLFVPPCLGFPRSGRSSSVPSGFTLTELLVVISLIVIILALAVPAFNLISGSGSIDQAQNQISAMFAQAQATAVDRENYVGVLFYKDVPADRYTLVLVEKVKPNPWIYQYPNPTGTGFIPVNYRVGDVVSR